MDILSSKSLEAKVWKHCPRALTNDEVLWFLHKKSISKDISHVLKRHNYKAFLNDNDNETWTHEQKSVFFNARYIGTCVKISKRLLTNKMCKQFGNSMWKRFKKSDCASYEHLLFNWNLENIFFLLRLFFFTFKIFS